jgi:LytTr DNA-binding domain
MINPFKRPFRRFEAARDRLISIFVFGLFIFLFLFVFKPFGMNSLKENQQFFISLGFGMVTTFMLFIFKYLLEPVVTKNNWTLGKNLLWDFCIASSIGVANYFYICTIFHQILVFRYLLFAVWAAILVGIIPVTISYIVTFNRIYRNALKEAAIPPEKIFREDEINLRAGNPRNELKLNPKDIIYLCSNDNYVTVVTVKGDVQNKITIRGTLKAAESELSKNGRFLRCHKCYIVNLDYAGAIRGHYQNMTIRLLPSGPEIPVSRSKAEIIQKIKKKN